MSSRMSWSQSGSVSVAGSNMLHTSRLGEGAPWIGGMPGAGGGTTTAGTGKVGTVSPAAWPSFAMSAMREVELSTRPAPPSSASSFQLPDTSGPPIPPIPAPDELSITGPILSCRPSSSSAGMPTQALANPSGSRYLTNAKPLLLPRLSRCNLMLSRGPNCSNTARREASSMLMCMLPTYRRLSGMLGSIPGTPASSGWYAVALVSFFARKFFSASEALTRMGNFWKSGTTLLNMRQLGMASRSFISTYAKPL